MRLTVGTEVGYICTYYTYMYKGMGQIVQYDMPNYTHRYKNSDGRNPL